MGLTPGHQPSEDSPIVGEDNLKSAIAETRRQLRESKSQFGEDEREKLLQELRTYERLLKSTQQGLLRGNNNRNLDRVGPSKGSKKMGTDPLTQLLQQEK